MLPAPPRFSRARWALGFSRARWALGAAGIAIGLGLALTLPAEATQAVAGFFDTYVVEAFHGLALERFLCL